MPLIDVPGKGLVEFPYDMPQEDILAAVQRLSAPERPPGPGTPKPSFLSALGQSAVERAGEIGNLPSDAWESAKNVGAYFADRNTPLRLAGSTVPGVGVVGGTGLNMLTEALAQANEGDFQPTNFALNAAPLAVRGARGLTGAARGGAAGMNRALATGGGEVMNPSPIQQATGAIERRLGTPPTSPASARLNKSVQNRPGIGAQPGPTTLQGVEDIRRSVGPHAGSRNPAVAQNAGQLYRSAMETLEQPGLAGRGNHPSPASQDLLQGIGREAARKAATSPLTLKEILAALGLGGGGAGALWQAGQNPILAALLALGPGAQRAFSATRAIRPWLPEVPMGAGASAGLGGPESP